MYEYEYSYILYRYSWERLIVAVLDELIPVRAYGHALRF
jgi:hypothetical protein